LSRILLRIGTVALIGVNNMGAAARDLVCVMIGVDGGEFVAIRPDGRLGAAQPSGAADFAGRAGA
jgi:hypothetical protein